jgi:hypothetical protein
MISTSRQCAFSRYSAHPNVAFDLIFKVLIVAMPAEQAAEPDYPSPKFSHANPSLGLRKLAVF